MGLPCNESIVSNCGDCIQMNTLNQFQTDQETFWAGRFGTEYIQRNQGDAMLASNLSFFAKALHATRGIQSCIEFGANIGINLKALKILYPNISAYAIEINADAVRELAKMIPASHVHHTSILDFQPYQTWDLVLTKGVLIHIAPERLTDVYNLLYSSSHRYICIAEYYNPTPVELTYRGYTGKLFKRDFAGEMLDRFNDLKLVDYGFVYHRDQFPQDDINWFLLEKGGRNA